MSWDAELEAFKTRIDLREYAAAQGYIQDKRESTKTGTAFVMRRGDDKISVFQEPDGHWVYYSFRDDWHGTILDFIQRLKGLSFGRIRQELRPWLDSSFVVPVHFSKVEPQTRKNKGDLKAQWLKMLECSYDHAYLEDRRRIPRATLMDSRFFHCIYMDHRGNAIFPHYDCLIDFMANPPRYPCGWEIKNYGFTGFLPGGKKGLWMSKWYDAHRLIVVCESAIDALSHAALFGDSLAMYVSTAGQLSDTQRDLLNRLVDQISGRLPRLVVVAATDADEAGGRLANEIFTISRQKGLGYFRQIPVGYKDWNEVLLARRRRVQ